MARQNCPLIAIRPLSAIGMPRFEIAAYRIRNYGRDSRARCRIGERFSNRPALFCAGSAVVLCAGRIGQSSREDSAASPSRTPALRVVVRVNANVLFGID